MNKETGILIASGLLVLLLVWKEIKRPAKAQLALRILASIGAVAAMAFLVLPVSYTVSTSGTNHHTANLLTPGYPKDSLTNTTGDNQYTTHPDLATKDIHFIPDLAWFLDQYSHINTLDIWGYGLTETELAALSSKGIALQYHAPAPPTGFTAAGWSRRINQGQWLEVQGAYHAMGNDTVKIVLTGVGARFDSVMIRPGATEQFSLRCQPTHLGNTLYELEAISKGKTTHHEKLPVHISPAHPLQVLLVSSSPDFDNKFLITWLYENQYKVAIRNSISKNKYSRQFLNRDALPLQNITTSLLEQFDLVIMDDQQLTTLTTPEKNALRTQIQKGLGLILQTDSAHSFPQLSTELQVKKQAASPVSPRSLAIPALYVKTSPLQPTEWFSIESGRQAQPLVMDDQGAVVVSAAIAGAGKLVLNTVNNTYSWLLNGNRQDYAQFWTLLLNKAVRPGLPESRWQGVSAFPSIGSPVTLTLETRSAGIPLIETLAGKVAPEQQAWLPQSWTGWYWPTTTGWQVIRHGADSLHLYIYDGTDWQGVQATNSIMANSRYTAISGKARSSKGTVQGQTKKELPPVIFFMVFLLCCSYLWFEDKRRN
jgi:hypothetical protein